MTSKKFFCVKVAIFYTMSLKKSKLRKMRRNSETIVFKPFRPFLSLERSITVAIAKNTGKVLVEHLTLRRHCETARACKQSCNSLYISIFIILSVAICKYICE